VGVVILKSLIAGMLALFASHHEDRTAIEAKAHQELMLAEAIETEALTSPRSPREWAALMLAIAENETHGSLRIHEGHCRPLECDRGRARGLWQEHRNKRNAPIWDQLVGVENTAVQVASASEALKRSYWHWNKYCRVETPDWVVGTATVFAGRSCRTPWAGARARLASFRKFFGARVAS
jgi:hypothetical protein